MESELKNKLSNVTDREQVKNKRNPLIYLLFFVVSIICWYLIALSKEYTTIISYPVVYQSLPKGKVLALTPPEKLNIKVKGFGFTILKTKLFSYINPIKLSISIFGAEIKQTGNRYLYYLLSQNTKEWISNQLDAEIQVISILPDTLFFNFTDIVDKKVPVQLVSNLSYAKQFMPHGKIIIRPDSVIVSGPQVILDTLKYVSTNMLTLNEIKDTVSKEVTLLSIPKFIFTTTTVVATIPVVKYTEMVLNIPIEPENLPDSLKLKTFPSYITLSCWVGLSDYSKMTPFMFRATIDYNILKTNYSNKVKIKLAKIPFMVNNITFQPKSVEYIIEK